jgi:hypothetical protein
LSASIDEFGGRRQRSRRALHLRRGRRQHPGKPLHVLLEIVGQLHIACHDRPAQHRAGVVAALVGQPGDPQVERFRTELDLSRMRQVLGIADDAALMRRVLVEDVERVAEDLVRRHRKQVLHGVERLEAGLVDVGDVEIGIAHHDVDRHAVWVSSRAFSVASSQVSIGPV